MADLNPTMRAVAVTLVMPFLGTLAHAQGTTSLNTFGMPGLSDIPTAQSLEDADLATSLAISEGQSRSTLTFQITPRLTGSFRYSRIDGFRGTDLDLYDRSFDLHYRLIDEGAFRPALAIGLRDLVGTGVYSAEYFVASKNLSQEVLVTAGIGWGAMGSYNGFDNPLAFLGERFESRSTFEGEGGEPNIDNWFHGPAALFAGVRWQASDRLTFSAEYSSDDQSRQQGGGDAGLASPFNFGVQYRVGAGTLLGAQVLQGETVGVSAHFVINPRKPNYGGDVSAAPMPVLVRGDTAATWAGAINQDTLPDQARTDALRRLLENEGITLNAIALRETSVRVNIHSTRYDAPAQAIGRTARALAFTMPAKVETFEIVLVEKGVPLSQVTLSRSALERLDYAPDAVEQSLAVTRFDAGSRDGDMTQLPFERFSWSVGPYVGFSFFDPDNPLRADLGVDASGSYALTRALSVSGSVRGKLLGNRNQATRLSDSVLPRVRSDSYLYAQGSDLWLDRLTLDHFGKLSDDLYTRVSVGYLEEMFAGISGEVLWKPVDSRLALGAELNHVMQRDTDRLFGFDEYDYEVTTGHVSGYYALANGFDLQLDVGRYLAGDWGGTIGIDRRFRNGWTVGAFATLTDVSFEDFGEGSFDKGIRFTIPLSWALGQPNQTAGGLTLRPVQRDGGARLAVGNRLYPAVRDHHAPELREQWGRFWR